MRFDRLEWPVAQAMCPMDVASLLASASGAAMACHVTVAKPGTSGA